MISNFPIPNQSTTAFPLHFCTHGQRTEHPRARHARVVIVGGGFAGLKLAKGINSDSYQTVLVDRNNYHTFQPLMYQVVT